MTKMFSLLVATGLLLSACENAAHETATGFKNTSININKAAQDIKDRENAPE